MESKSDDESSNDESLDDTKSQEPDLQEPFTMSRPTPQLVNTFARALCDNLKGLYDLTLVSPESKYISFCYDKTKRDLYVQFNGYKKTDYENGQYLIHINLPENYPARPPMIRVLSESGRFMPGCWLSLTISHYHPEHWVPLSLEHLVVNVISAFTDNLAGIGHMKSSVEDKKIFAQNSREYNKKHYPQLTEMFNRIDKDKQQMNEMSKDQLNNYVEELKSFVTIEFLSEQIKSFPDLLSVSTSCESIQEQNNERENIYIV